MKEKLANTDLIIKHWVESSEEDLKAMRTLFTTKSYAWALFIGHITIEKLLKAIYVKKHSSNAPFTHNLYRLAELSEIELSDEKADWLDLITSFNIEARYDDYKKEFYSLCNYEFTNKWIKRIEEILLWLKQIL
ncbi:MAG: HEPN domain-containing protein [Ignavibacteria bacterium]|jgi:HEPN domain-containing protein|nr:HEPN domain-containing protein [Ignavibacteria bacterium]